MTQISEDVIRGVILPFLGMDDRISFNRVLKPEYRYGMRMKKDKKYDILNEEWFAISRRIRFLASIHDIEQIVIALRSLVNILLTQPRSPSFRKRIRRFITFCMVDLENIWENGDNDMLYIDLLAINLRYSL